MPLSPTTLLIANSQVKSGGTAMKWTIRLLVLSLICALLAPAAPILIRHIAQVPVTQVLLDTLAQRVLRTSLNVDIPDVASQIATQAFTKSMFAPYYIFVGVTNSAESRPGGGLLAGYALIEVYQTEIKIVTIAANETFGREPLAGFENYAQIFGPTISTFFDSTLVPDVELTSAIVSEHFLKSSGFRPDLYVYIDNEALIELLGEDEFGTWLAEDQYMMKTKLRNSETRKRIGRVDKRALFVQLLKNSSNLFSRGQLRISDLQENSYDALRSQSYSPSTLLMYASNPVANKLDSFIKVTSSACLSGSKVLLKLRIKYDPPMQVWGYQAGYPKKYARVSPPETTVAFFFLGKFNLDTEREKAGSGYSREGFYIDRNWRTYQVRLVPNSEVIRSFKFTSNKIDSLVNLTSMSKPQKKSIVNLQTCS